MLIIRRIMAGSVGIVLVFVVAACRLAQVAEVLPDTNRPAAVTVTQTPTAQPVDDVVWGRVPYCSCLADTATTNVSDALKKANLTVSLKEVSPRDGWLYFVVTFDPQAATLEQVGAAMLAGGAEVLDGPP